MKNPSTPASLHLVVPIRNAVHKTTLLFVLVYHLTLDDLQIAVLNVLSILIVFQVLLVSIKNVKTHALDHVVLMLNVACPITYLCVPAAMVLLAIRLLTVMKNRSVRI